MSPDRRCHPDRCEECRLIYEDALVKVWPEEGVGDGGDEAVVVWEAGMLVCLWLGCEVNWNEPCKRGRVEVGGQVSQT